LGLKRVREKNELTPAGFSGGSFHIIPEELMEFTTIKYSTPEPGIGVVTLNRPQRLNAINLDMLDEIHTLCNDLDQRNDERVIIITGEGRGFCSGADLMDERIHQQASTFFSSAAAFLMNIQKKYSRLIVEMREIPQPIIAAVNGPAAGGGMCLVLAADVIIGCPHSSFTPSFINIGLSGGELGTTYFLPRLIGSARAADILLTGRTVDATEAEKIGLISRLVTADKLIESAMQTARTMLDKSPVGLRLTKETLNQNLNAPSLQAAVELENRNQSICCLTPEFFKAVEKFGKSNKS
jgi:enoyl-CoA hydratase